MTLGPIVSLLEGIIILMLVILIMIASGLLLSTQCILCVSLTLKLLTFGKNIHDHPFPFI